MTNTFDSQHIYRHDFKSSYKIFEFFESSWWITHYCKVREGKDTMRKVHVEIGHFSSNCVPQLLCSKFSANQTKLHGETRRGSKPRNFCPKENQEMELPFLQSHVIYFLDRLFFSLFSCFSCCIVLLSRLVIQTLD